MRFDEIIQDDALIDAIAYMGFADATEIQEHAIPLILKQTDLIACAQTGTGKTAAFVIPLLSLLRDQNLNSKGVKALIVVPTRELAVQIDREIQGIAYFLDLTSIAIYGGGNGSGWDTERRALTDGIDIVVATPGRLLSHLKLGGVHFSNLRHFILDEADKMLDMGFFEDILKISTYLPKKRQTLMFSATMPPKIRQLTRKLLYKPAELNFNLSKPAEGINQRVYPVLEKHKMPLIEHILTEAQYERVLIFTSTKLKVREVVRALKRSKLNVEGVSSDLEQNEREEILRQFKAGNLRVLVATDVLSRGIDIKNIHLIINYSVPNDAEDYVHRVGRTARADKTGVAVTMVTPDEMGDFDQIERLIETKLNKLSVPFAPKETPAWIKSGRKNFKKRNYKSSKKSRKNKNYGKRR
ncbi:MAG: DEAD/DEAH box helicase [Bacteroidota bacterium]|nr:DEAD/DEAH box helicase [Bacteroidota bacterium]